MAASPTANIGFQNFYEATLTSDITASAVDIPLDVVPSVSEGILVIDPDSDSREVIYYNSKTATKVVCPSAADGRGQDDTTAVSHTQGTAVIMAPVALFFETLLSLFQTSPQGWTGVATTASSVTYNGNRSYTLSVTDNLTSTLSPGMRLRTTRGTAAPTQSTSLNGTSQYWSKAVPNGMSNWTAFTLSAWVKLTSYADGTIIRRANTAGFSLHLQSNGTIRVFYGTGSAFTDFVTYQSLPLNKWVHVTGVVTSTSGKTGAIYLDGISVPIQSTITSAASMTQDTVALTVGATHAPGAYFPGAIAQASIFSSALSQSTIRGMASQTLSGSESTCVSAWSFNNSANDLNTTNANNLTASGSATATNADSPFGGQADGTISSTLDYGIIAKVTASAITVNVAEGCAIPTSGSISSMSYSTYKSPFGFPGEKGKWTVRFYSATNLTGAFAATVTWTALTGSAAQLTVPVGSWRIGYQFGAGLTSSVSGNRNGLVTVAPTGLAATSSNLTSRLFDSTGTSMVNNVSRHDDTTLSTATVYQPYWWVYSATGTETFSLNGAEGGSDIYAENAYL